jgi:2-methylisocitrate lyase-like PEP mutase family enzyme
MYRDAGADVFFPEALLGAEELERCSRDVELPLVYNLSLLGISPLIEEPELAGLGVFVLFLPSLALHTATAAFVNALDRLRDGGLAGIEGLRTELRAHSAVGDMHSLVGFPEMMALEDELLPSEDQLARYSGSLGYQPAKR